MRIVQIKISWFRGFAELTANPRNHALFVGPPGCGRSDIIEAISRVLDVEGTRWPVDDLDFHGRDTSKPIVIEVTLAELSEVLLQRFLAHTEAWDLERRSPMSDLDAAVASDDHPRVLRLSYRASWSEVEDRAESVVFFSKGADPDRERYDRVTRQDRAELPYFRVQPASQPLSLADRSPFRRIIEGRSGDDFADAVRETQEALEVATSSLTDSDQLGEALDAVTRPVRRLLGLPSKPSESIRFTPGDGSLSSILRSLTPELGTDDSALPLSRLGTTASSILAVTQAAAAVTDKGGIVAIDDLGDRVDTLAARHLATLLLGRAGQVLATTRRPQVAGAFDPLDVMRLTNTEIGNRCHTLSAPTTRRERTLVRHYARPLLEAADAEAVVVTEGMDDLVSIEAVARRMAAMGKARTLTSVRAAVVEAGLGAGGGGKGNVIRLTRLAAGLGFRTVAVLDGDADETELDAALETASSVVLLPRGAAIERLLVTGLDHQEGLAALSNIAATFELEVSLPDTASSEAELGRVAVEVLKKRGKGLHSQFVNALAQPPPGGVSLVEALHRAAAGADGLIEL